MAHRKGIVQLNSEVGRADATKQGGTTSMKVFISHSSGDRWIAEKISEEIEQFGIDTFLDAQNLEAGDDFDEEIRRQLTESDEILIVISAAALKSHWVMMEFGAARTLGKRLVLILVGISPNE